MTDTKHTPGPWGRVWNEYTITNEINDQDETLIASTYGRECLGEESANARLIAAAPELLAALETVVKYGAVFEDQAVKNQCERAIAKARGES